MIIDKWRNSNLYYNLHPFLEEGASFANSLIDSPAGKYEYKHGIFALVQTGETADISLNSMECHRKFLDVQIVVTGKELVVWEEIQDTEIDIPYVSKNDVELRRGKGRQVIVSQSEFYILMPQDCHKCCGVVDDSSSFYRKIVLKLPI